MSGKFKLIVVTVESGVIVCTPSQPALNGANFLLAWQLQTSGYAFPANDAIVLSSANTQFPYDYWSINATNVAIFDLNTTASGVQNYTIKVIDLSNNSPITLMPSIKNEG